MAPGGRLGKAILLSAALHGAALCWAWPGQEPPARRPNAQDLALTSLRVRLAAAAAVPTAPAQSAHAAKPFSPSPKGAAPERARRGASTQDAPTEGSGNTPNNARSDAAPEGPQATPDRPFAQEIQWPDFAMLGPGSFGLDIEFGPGGAPSSIQLRWSSFDDETNARLLAMLQEAKAPKAGSASLEFTIDPPVPPSP